LLVVLAVVLSVIGLAALAVVFRFELGPAVTHLPAEPVASAVKTAPVPQTPEELYVDLLKKTLTRAQVAGRVERRPPESNGLIRNAAFAFLNRHGFEMVKLVPSNADSYTEPVYKDEARVPGAETMVGLKQLDNVQFCVTDVLRRKVPGDLIEAGAWRGGVTILMRGILKAYGDRDRKVWVADSFQGLPPVNRAQNVGWSEGQMAVSVEEVRENFANFGMLDDQVRFLKGFFSETLPTAAVDKLAVFRSDADLYESTRDALVNLYPKLSVGGYAIFDDYMQLPGCRKAIDEYRAEHGISEPIQHIDRQAVYWRREK
jgi:O-methyltransferase